MQAKRTRVTIVPDRLYGITLKDKLFFVVPFLWEVKGKRRKLKGFECGNRNTECGILN